MEVLEFLSKHIILTLFLLIGLGAIIGRIRVKGVSLGAAAVLFVSIGLSALAFSNGVDLEIPEVVGTLGLTMFTFTIGITSGANFFSSLRRGWKLILSIIGILVGVAAIAVLIGRVLGLDAATIGGAFSGAVTNTPALAAVNESAGSNVATVAYAVTYVFGVIGMLIFTALALRHAPNDTDKPVALVSQSIRLDIDEPISLVGLEKRYGDQIKFSRIQHDESRPPETPTIEEVLRRGDIVTVLGPADLVKAVTKQLGHKSSHNLDRDREHLDVRRITISNHKHAGKTIGELALELEDKFSATITRIRRGDVEFIASDDFILQEGDRPRIIAPRKQIKAVSRFFGDSSNGLSDVAPITFGIGMALGILLGTVTIPGIDLALGAAAGTLIVGLILGRLGRIGHIATTMPFSASQTITELGLLIFLTQAGTKAGGQIIAAFASGEWLKILLLGVIITLLVAGATYFLLRRVFHIGGTKLSGILAGTQTQPAILAYANQETKSDARVALGYALIYPAAMVAKIVIGQILGKFG